MPFEYLIDADDLKACLPEYMAAIGHQPRFHVSGTKFTTNCPLHYDHNPSFSATLKDSTWLWKCFPCDQGGTVIDLHAALYDLEATKDFRRICLEIADVIGKQAPFQFHRPKRQEGCLIKDPPHAKSIPPSDLVELTNPWRTRLFEDRALRKKFASDLGLKAETLARLCMPELDSWGIAPQGFQLKKQDGGLVRLNNPRLCYIGDGGYKIREPFGKCGTPRFWRVGTLQRPWRSHRLISRNVEIENVHLVESESSAAALIESGFEDPFGQKSCVVATSGSNGFQAAWVPMFEGRVVHFWPDSDEAGHRFLDSTAVLLKTQAKKLLVHNYNQPVK
ncbi:MAG: CHC2 zinc finger domain-containing protein [Prosthecobacter sp.]